MALTRSRAADRALSARRAAVLPYARSLEGALLVVASIALALGFALVYQARTSEFAAVEQQLAAGETVNLAALSRPDELVPHLAFLAHPNDRAFAARRIYEHAQDHRIQSAR